MSVWSFEAAEITDSIDLEARPIYRTPAIDAFLSFDKSPTRIISGLKGTGKTLFLKLISHHFRKRGGVTLVPTTELTERLYSIDFDFSGEKAKAWASHERWKQVWRTVLSVIVLRALRVGLPGEIFPIFPATLGLSIGAHLSAALRSRAVNTLAFQELFSTVLDSAIQGISQPVAIFVDNIDEALARHAGYDLYRDSLGRQPQSGTHSYDLWLAAQIGFMLAVRELTARNAHLKLYGTVRAEAVRDNPTSTAFNAQAMILDLHYTPLELRGIFQTKLRRLHETSPQFFARRDHIDPLNAFFQDDTISHTSVVDELGKPYQEDVFEYLRRHTRGRPRELDFLGYALQKLPPDQRTPENIRKVVRDLSHEFFGFARNEAVPFWDPRLDQLLEKLPSNFVRRREAERLAQRLFGIGDAVSLWSALYANGLCGAVVPQYPKGMIQRFANHDGVAELGELDFRSARTWVVHPCVNIATRPRRRRYNPHPRNVAGHAYSFVGEPKHRKKHLHVLIGAGRLGWGLVVPTLLADPDTTVLVIARHSSEWESLAAETTDGQCRLETVPPSPGRKPRDTTAMRVHTDEAPDWKAALQKDVRRNRCVLLVCKDEMSLQWALGLADSIGVSVGGDKLDAVAQIIVAAGCKPKTVLGYENDTEALHRASHILEKHEFVFVPTVVDRICVRREITREAVIVHTELYGQIVALVTLGQQRSIPPAFTSGRAPLAKVISDPEEFAFIREKKRRLVNSLHAAAAALVQSALIGVGAKEETADDVLLGLISFNMDIGAQLLTVKELLILSVLGSMPSHRLEEGASLSRLIAELHEYGDKALARMREGPDIPSRVLRKTPESLSAKYETLFSDVEQLALDALQYQGVRAAFPIDDKEVKARLSALNEAFLRLLSKAARRKIN